MIDQQILAYSQAKGFHSRTLERWLKLTPVDREALLNLARGLKMGENHFRDFLDWMEEIALRDGVSLCEILKGDSLLRISSDPRLSRNDKLKHMKEELRRLRFPRLARIEEEIRRRVHELKLSAQIQITVAPGLEGGGLTVQMKAGSYEELARLAKELGALPERKAMREIFDLLEGRPAT
jgi:hypothetical protein